MLLVQREKYLKRNSQDAIFYLNAHNIKLLTRDSNEACAVIILWSHFVYKQHIFMSKGFTHGVIVVAVLMVIFVMFGR